MPSLSITKIHIRNIYRKTNSFLQYFQHFTARSSTTTAPSSVGDQVAPSVATIPDTTLEKQYTSEQKNKILKVLNESTADQLREYDISKMRAKSLVRHRKKAGQLLNVDDVLEVDGFGLGTIQTLFDSIIYGLSEDSKRQHASVWQQLCHPNISDALAQKIASVVSLHILPQEILWLHLSRKLEVIDWQTMAIHGNRTYDHKANLELAYSVVNKLPKADAYLLEKRQMKSPQPKTVPLLLGIVQLEAMMTTLLNTDLINKDCQHQVFAIKRSLVGRFFSLKVGNENVSGQNIVKQLQSGMHCMNLRKVFIDPSTLFWYQNQVPSSREELAALLLQAVAFYELEVARKIPKPSPM